MAVTTTSEAARAVASNVRARRIAAKEENDRAYEAYRRADTTTPLGNGTMMPTEQLPDPPALFEEQPIVEERAITLRTQIQYRGRAIWIEAKGLTLDSFCDMIDRRLEAQQ
jgi:hypothetical protein